jgi:excinuclease UvrABC nuclease subunit
MKEAAEKLDFEKAIEFRDAIAELTRSLYLKEKRNSTSTEKTPMGEKSSNA